MTNQIKSLMTSMQHVMLKTDAWHKQETNGELIVAIRLPSAILLEIPGTMNIWKKEKFIENERSYEMHIDYSTNSHKIRVEVIFNNDEVMNMNFIDTVSDPELDGIVSQLNSELATCWELLSRLPLHQKVFKRRTINFN